MVAKIFSGFILAFCLLSHSLIWAASGSNGFSVSSSATKESLQYSPEQIVRFAKKVETVMAKKGAYVAILARKGRPASEMPQGMVYTHTAFAVYSTITTKDGRQLPGYAIYNLYQRADQPDVSDLVTDFPPDFFAGVAELEAGLILPSPKLQQRLLATITSPTYGALHDSHYSVIANPFTLGRQNCTEFVLDVINAAIYQTDDITRIKMNERDYFQAQQVNVNPFKLLLGSWFTSEVSLSDQPGDAVTATFTTIGEYLLKYDKGAELLRVLPD
ncbi:DUF2145 domain-containing protein [Desulfobulbus rhabdoformis]|uniref:DUF2145 domain-containing protein n=1 Tax=Desulfobulbus rhabdoformis TaxID=34032 RepID=UPI001962D616|nr:DUF2145 domain-containing protein [Desulfobulbus rhabdoformis]MBM9613463.1 DUF2145 domain-containing protein [Desulfobulbus rhabdoformis]